MGSIPTLSTSGSRHAGHRRHGRYILGRVARRARRCLRCKVGGGFAWWRRQNSASCRVAGRGPISPPTMAGSSAVERPTVNRIVAGSIPAPSAIMARWLSGESPTSGDMWESGGSIPPRASMCPVAQLAEHRSPKPGVVGSSPTGRAKRWGGGAWFNAPGC